MEENMNLGKSLDWFLHARSILYTRHPTTKNHYCLRYKFIGKSDDDTVIHLPRLSTFLKTLHPQKSHYIGRSFNDAYMSGMFYLLTPDLTEWIHHSPIPKQNRKGHEDRQVGVWFVRGNITWGIYLAKTFTFHDLEEAPNIFARKSTRESVAVHWCKDGPKMFRCIADLYGTPEVAVKRLTSPGSLERHRELVSRVFPEFDSQRLVNLTLSPDFNIDTQRTQQLIKPLVENMMPKFIRDPFTEADLNQVVEHLAARFPMFKNDTERSIWRALAAKNISSTTVAWENYVSVRLENVVKDANGQPLSWNQLYEIRKPWLNAWVG
ncbi:hypothetical protein HDU79_011679 [Rhizoclosmatium sp. JEL0117]|nr:hypothetical protein HDU79_011679 [Rhizoclosmatium sp. JEL0117]